jgi:cytidylate kinase
LAQPSTIAIDGPAASGKSTVGALLAENLGYVYFDTGVMYRAVTWAALARSIAIEDEIDVLRPTVDDGRQYTVLANGQDVTWAIRAPQVDHGVSPVSAYPGVRAALTRQQRRIGSRGGIVMVGRDIGTVVLPDADLKIYLDASLEQRIERRYQEVLGRGEAADREAVAESVRRRDQIDSGRALAPLRLAEDAVWIDTSSLTVEQVLERLQVLVEGWSAQDPLDQA